MSVEKPEIVVLPDGRKVEAWGSCVTCLDVGVDCKLSKQIVFYFWNPEKVLPGFESRNSEVVQICSDGNGWWWWLDSVTK